MYLTITHIVMYLSTSILPHFYYPCYQFFVGISLLTTYTAYIHHCHILIIIPDYILIAASCLCQLVCPILAEAYSMAEASAGQCIVTICTGTHTKAGAWYHRHILPHGAIV